MSKFSQLNDKHFYFPNRIVSLPFGHLALREIDEYKKDKGQRVEKYIWTEKETFRIRKKRTQKHSENKLFK